MTAAMRSLAYFVFLLCLVLAGIASAHSRPASRSVPAGNPWEQIIQALASGQKIKRQGDGDRILYFITSKRAHTPLSAGISVAPKGTFLDRAEYEKAYAAADDDERQRKFPAGGMRAMLTSFFFGPDGSSYGIVSTTFDDRFDVKIVVADKGSAHAPGDEGFFDGFALNQRLHRAASYARCRR
jgi:hypothetical protein